MKLILSILTALSVAAPHTDNNPSEHPWFIYGTKQSNRSLDWIKFISLGDRDFPIPILWFSASQIKTSGMPELTVKLHPNQLAALRIFNDDWHCSDQHTSPSLITLQINGHFKMKDVSECRMKKKQSCIYLNSLMKSKYVGLTLRQSSYIRKFSDGIKCEV